MTQQNFKWTLSLQVDGGPTVTVPGNLALDDCDTIALTLKPGDQKPVAVPGAAGKVQLLFVRCDLLGVPPATPPVTVAVGGGTPVPIDQTFFLTGTMAVKLLADPIGTLTFKNNDGSKTANVQIVVGRYEN